MVEKRRRGVTEIAKTQKKNIPKAQRYLGKYRIVHRVSYVYRSAVVAIVLLTVNPADDTLPYTACSPIPRCNDRRTVHVQPQGRGAHIACVPRRYRP